MQEAHSMMPVVQSSISLQATVCQWICDCTLIAIGISGRPAESIQICHSKACSQVQEHGMTTSAVAPGCQLPPLPEQQPVWWSSAAWKVLQSSAAA